jgi:hypothetical protein
LIKGLAEQDQRSPLVTCRPFAVDGVHLVPLDDPGLTQRIMHDLNSEAEQVDRQIDIFTGPFDEISPFITFYPKAG